MKLFVWVNPYRVSYGNSLLMVVAENVEDARTLAQSKAAKWYSYGKFPNGSPSYHNYGQPGMEENWSREEYDWKLAHRRSISKARLPALRETPKCNFALPAQDRKEIHTLRRVREIFRESLSLAPHQKVL